MAFDVDLIKAVAILGIACWMVYKFFSLPDHPIRRGQEKLCEPWWKHR